MGNTLMRKNRSSRNAFANGNTEIFIGGRDEAHIGADGLVATYALEFLLLDGAEELSLDGHVHFTDFIKEEGAAVGQFKLADLAFGGAGNDPFSWPKSSLSKRLSGMAAQLMATKGACWGLLSWMARVTSSLPVPLSP